MDEPQTVNAPVVTVTAAEIFDGGSNDVFIEITDWASPVTYFVGRNGSGKSRAARRVAAKAGGRLLGTDRLVGLMNFNNYTWGSVPTDYKGIPIGDQQEHMRQQSRALGSATDILANLREKPDVWLRVAAFLRRALGRTIELRESAGYLDPFVRLRSAEYSLLRDEGHGLRELVVLLAATYSSEDSLIVVDEPELHLHPSMARLWLTELNRECTVTGRRAIVVTHEPSLLRPNQANDLAAVWLFAADSKPVRIFDAVLPQQVDRVTASIKRNPLLLSQIVFAPRPVLVEGQHDVAALGVALARTHPPEVVAQTELVDCGGSGGVSLWLEVSSKLGLDVRAIADLDAMFAPEVSRVMDSMPSVCDAYRLELSATPERTSTVLRPLLDEMSKGRVDPDPRARAQWLAKQVEAGSGHEVRRDKLVDIWRRAGLWLHKQGTLEDVLQIADKGVMQARDAAEQPGAIDAVASWCAFALDPAGDVEFLLNVAVETIAHSIMEAERADPSVRIDAPVGPGREANGRLVQVQPLSNGRYRITALAPPAFAGYWVEFSRNTPASRLVLAPPDQADEHR